jgi:hypothetical protein
LNLISNPLVHVCMTAPANIKPLKGNVSEVRKGLINKEKSSLIKEYWELVHHTKKWFM